MKATGLMLIGHVALGAVVPRSGHVVHERRDMIPASWVDDARVHSSMVMPVRIGLAPSNLDHGHNLLMELSNHVSTKYKQWLSAEDTVELFAPAADTVSTVRQWLEAAGIASERISQSSNKQWLQFDGHADEVESLFGAEYYVHTHETSGKSHISCKEYHLPEHISRLVDYVTPGVMPVGVHRRETPEMKKRSSYKLPPLWKPLPKSMAEISDKAKGASTSNVCSAVITPDCLFQMYNFSAATSAQKGNEMGIFEDLGDYYAQGDLNSFFEAIYPTIPQGTHPKLESVDGGVAPTTLDNSGPESCLDFQISYPLIWPQNSVLFQTDDPVYEANYTYHGFLNTLLSAIDGSYCKPSPEDPQYPDPAPGGFKGSLECGLYKPTNVISISYGGDETVESGSVAYQHRQCNEWMKLGLQGVTVVVSSGDAGVGQRDGCLEVGGTTASPNGTIFNPATPANCPYLLTVGSTFLPPGANPAADAEIATTRFPSGGGFSNIFTTPDYQKSAVAKYFERAAPPYPFYETSNAKNIGANGGVYNRQGRGFPDVSGIGDNVLIFNQGSPALIGGTSASTPFWGSIITRINDELLAKGERTVGFINPTLYAHPEVFHDITEGSNPECGSNGFEAAVGWDPVTGLGTPNFPKLLKLFTGGN